MEQNPGICIHCGKEHQRNPRVKKQQYCAAKACQRARRARWQRTKLNRDDDYRKNQARCQKQWQERNAGYYKRYRATHPAYEERNRTMQVLRDQRRKGCGTGERGLQMLAKMDSLLRPYYSRKGSRFKLLAELPGNLAKMDSLTVRLVPL